MIRLQSKKWRNVTVLSAVFFCIVLFFELIPLTVENLNQIWRYIANSVSQTDTDQLKREQNYFFNRRKELLAMKKLILISSRERQTMAGLIGKIDSLGSSNNCRLVSVHPSESKENKNSEMLMLIFSGDYISVYNMVGEFRNLPVFFSIKEFSFGLDEQSDNDLIANLLIELPKESDTK